MTSVGIMSMQRIHNYGSTLQAYSLRRLIEEVVPASTVSFLDYEPGDLLVEHAAGSGSKIGRVLAKVREYNAVDAPLRDRIRFFDHKRAYGRRYLSQIGVTDSPARNFDVDCHVIGSDEVFNCVQSNTNVGYSRELFGHGTTARRLISYAASFGNTTIEKIHAAGIANQIKADLEAFDSLSVRDRNSRNIVRELVGVDPQMHVDPALANDLMMDARIPAQRLHPDPYIIVYGYSGRLTDGENDALRRYADGIGARILTFGGLQRCGDAFIECSPFELLAYFRDAIGVVTDTFHGTIFSIINNTPFATIVRQSAGSGYGNEEKLGFLLDSFGLASRRAVDEANMEQMLGTPLDRKAIEKLLFAERSKAKSYLADNVAPL